MTTLLSTAAAAAADQAGSNPFLTALRAPAAHASLGHLYDGLLGSWEGEVVDHLPDGTDRRQSVEIHFAWVLEGRAIQDLWIAPARRERDADSPLRAVDGNRYGTTIRVYDPALDLWRITWNNPASGAETRLVGRKVGDAIVQTGADADGRLIRWVFDPLQLDSFHWRGERSEDGGATWICDTEFFVHRLAGGGAGTSAPGAGSPTFERQLSWEWTDAPGLEALRVTQTTPSIVADGSVVGQLEGTPLRAHYRIEHDRTWRFRNAVIELGAPGMERQLEIARRDDGSWEIDGAPRPDLAGCEDLDLMITPYTNTPPLEAKPLAPGESRTLRAAWVHFPDLAVHNVRQEYTRLDDGTGTPRFRYRNLESGWTGELTLDGDGLVAEYGSWRRR